jgi:uncharacterized CHY-type Zn-finger protein
MGKQNKQRIALLEKGEIKPYRNSDSKEQRLVCGKCNHQIPAHLAEAHLKECQPEGAVCSKCQQKIPVKEFLKHIETCTGVQQVKPENEVPR